MCLAKFAMPAMLGLLLGAVALTASAQGQTFGDLADSTADGVVLKAKAERAEAAHKLAQGGRERNRATDAPVAATKFVSKPGVFMAPTTPPPPPPPPTNAPIAPVQNQPAQSQAVLPPLPEGLSGGAQ